MRRATRRFLDSDTVCATVVPPSDAGNSCQEHHPPRISGPLSGSARTAETAERSARRRRIGALRPQARSRSASFCAQTGVGNGTTLAEADEGLDEAHSSELGNFGAGDDGLSSYEEAHMGQFIRVASTADLAPGETRCVEASGKKIALFNLDGSFYAIDNTCTHRGGPLCEGGVSGGEVTCPWHGAVYNFKTGAVLSGPAPRGV